MHTESSIGPMPIEAMWRIICGGFVLLMTIPGLALYYGGSVRRKNALHMMLQCVFSVGLLSLCWAAWGNSIAFGQGNAIWGDTSRLLLRHIQSDPESDPLGNTSQQLADLFYFGAICSFTAPLVCGAIAERMKFASLACIMALWMTLVFCPVTHWLWGGGFLDRDNAAAWFGGALDYSGGLVVHLSAGISALVSALIVGKRLGFSMDDMRPHNLTYVVAGASFLWVGALFLHGGQGWDSRAVQAVLHTHLSVAAGAVTWSMLEWLRQGRATALGTASGAIVGIVCAAPSCAYVAPHAAVLIALLSTIASYFTCAGLGKIRDLDDSGDVFGIHAVAASIGLIFTALLAIPGQAETFRGGRWGQLGVQMFAILFVTVWSALLTALILKLVDWTIGLRVSQDTEMRGLDTAEHGQEAYIWNK